MVKRENIGLLFPMESDYLYKHQVIRGILRYAHRHTQWNILTDQGGPTLRWTDVPGIKADGFIAGIHTPAQHTLLKKKKIPIVNLYHGLVDYPFTTVLTDNRLIGRMAAEHLMKQGLKNFAYIGSSTMGYDKMRMEGFGAALRQRKQKFTKCLVPYIPGSSGATGRMRVGAQRIASFVRQLDLPVGILAGTDNYGVGLLQACQKLKLAVPDQVAIVAVNNDDVLCDLMQPGLSSIAHDAEKIGYEAAKQLDRQMRGGKPPAKPIMIKPRDLVVRPSSDVLAIDDHHVAEAMRYIRNHAANYIDVSDILQIIPISRRSLETHFREIVGRTIHEEIRRVHIKRAKHLMTTTTLSIVDIAHQSGFNHTSRFREAFHKETGVSPTTYLAELKK